jgi:DNA topoisomerase-1
VIVESPAKARKIASYLGSDYVVESSRGHIRDLPRGAADVPAKYKGEAWARLGVDVDHAFEPLYIITPDKRATVTELRNALKGADELYLATDGDREGEAIAWHLMETLKPRVPVRRMVFHEITEPAIRAAAEHPRDLDQDLVDAQETRRILDRLYGYPHHRAARAGADVLRARVLLGPRRYRRCWTGGHSSHVRSPAG